MSIEGQGHFFTIYFPGFVCFVLYWDKTSGERLQDNWSSGLPFQPQFLAARAVKIDYDNAEIFSPVGNCYPKGGFRSLNNHV